MLKWKYCECGCHGHDLSVAGLDFWMFNDLEGNYSVHSGHGWMSPKIGTLKSFKAADAFVCARLRKVQREIAKVLS